MNEREITQLFKSALLTIGYEKQSIRNGYSFVDFESDKAIVRTIPLAAFSGYPCTYRNACIGVDFNNSNEDSSSWTMKRRTLGQRLLLEIRNRTVTPWRVGPESAERIQPEFLIELLASVFAEKKDAWNPTNLCRIQSQKDVLPNPQLDFYDSGLMPVLERFFQTKLRDLLERAFTEITSAYQSVHGAEPNVSNLFAFLFRFVTAKIFMDRADAHGWDGLSTPLDILKKAEKQSGSAKLPREFLNVRVLEKAWSCVSNTLHFQNLSVPDLAFIYESSFITDDRRKALGIHSTPDGLAQYIVEHLPWEQIPLKDRIVFEPFCGHGIFLARALERMGRDLNPKLRPSERHEYFRKRLIGVESDPLSVEVCRQVLTLSDYPNDNSWELHQHDVFDWKEWDKTLAKSSVVLANPPYEPFEADYRAQIKATKAQPPAEFLHRLMLHPPKLLGLVLPQSFLSSPFYREANRKIASHYEHVSIVKLPRIFRYANNQTIALMAWGLREAGNVVSVRFAEVACEEVDSFLNDFHVSNVRNENLQLQTIAKDFTLWIPRRNPVFDRLSATATIADVSNLIRKGVNWQPRTDGLPKLAPRADVAADIPRQGFHRGVEKMRGNLSQFRISCNRFLSLLDKDQDPSTQAHRHPWEMPKVVCNAARFKHGSPWRIAAWADDNGLAFTKQYFSIWPKIGVSEYALSAILCSPLINAFSFERDWDRDNHISTLSEMPIPALEHLGKSGIIHKQAKKLQKLLSPQFLEPEVSAGIIVEALIRLDAAVLDAYGLSAKEQRELLNQFQGWRRPVAVSFDRYFPDHFADEITLKDFVAINFDWDQTNDRRFDLIEKNISVLGLTDDEGEEYEHLQHLADLFIRLKAPYQLKKLDEMIAELKSEGGS